MKFLNNSQRKSNTHEKLPFKNVAERERERAYEKESRSREREREPESRTREREAESRVLNSAKGLF